MKRIARNAGLLTLATLFVAAFALLLVASNTAAELAAKISMPFAFFGLNLALPRAARPLTPGAAALLTAAANTALLAGYLCLLGVLG